MKVAFFSPLPPARTGVADYAAALLGALRRHGQVETGASEAGVALYHLGNNQLHREIYARALARPGVAVLHDAVLQHFFLGSLDERAYVEEFVYNYGEFRRGLAAEMWRGRAASGLGRRYFEYPMLRRIAEASRAVVVHNAGAARMVRAHHATARVVEIPHLFEPPAQPPAAEVLRFRERLGIPPGAFVFGVYGYLRESKRVMAVLRAFARVKRECPRAVLLVAGDFVSTDLARAAAPLLAAPGIVRLPYLAEPDFLLAASAADCCVNLRDPAAGETSGVAIRMMALAKPVLVTDGPENAAFPETACLRVPGGAAEQEALCQYMLLACSFPDAAREIGRRAAAYLEARHGLERVAGLYWNTLCECAR